MAIREKQASRKRLHAAVCSDWTMTMTVMAAFFGSLLSLSTLSNQLRQLPAFTEAEFSFGLGPLAFTYVSCFLQNMFLDLAPF